jgi:hypothetical protein
MDRPRNAVAEFSGADTLDVGNDGLLNRVEIRHSGFSCKQWAVGVIGTSRVTTNQRLLVADVDSGYLSLKER